MDQWKYDGECGDFVGNVKWALVFRKLGKEKPPGWNKIISSEELVLEKAAEYGITSKAVASEMVRLGTEALLFMDYETE